MKKRGLPLFGIILIITGSAMAVFTAFLFVNQFTLMDHLPAEQQYVMGAILAVMFIVIGVLMLQEQTNT